eukprot:SAG11_NODE_108_length_16386_cov_20.828329_4_plen_142_part_00
MFFCVQPRLSQTFVHFSIDCLYSFDVVLGLFVRYWASLAGDRRSTWCYTREETVIHLIHTASRPELNITSSLSRLVTTHQPTPSPSDLTPPPAPPAPIASSSSPSGSYHQLLSRLLRRNLHAHHRRFRSVQHTRTTVRKPK